MAGRNHPYSRTLNSRPSNIVDTHRLIHSHRQPQANPAAVIEAQQREIQILLRDNQRLAANHVVLNQELAAADQELRHLSSTAAKVKADCDARVREVYESSLKTEAELRSLDAMSVELVQVKSDIENMTVETKELTAKLREINEALASSAPQLEGFPGIEEELQTMRQEIKRGRAAIEYEKKMHASNLEQSEVLDKNVVSMAREIEKLRAELADAEKRAKAAASAAAVPAPPGICGLRCGVFKPLLSFQLTDYDYLCVCSYEVLQIPFKVPGIPLYFQWLRLHMVATIMLSITPCSRFVY
ncbi:OLC1v1006326C2 [Oldenlandia corymbosa var. corymbosa]|uniref:OLC1v1006326C2 n=1 Tax=Oldenlandia corymbosa var. corymbosa TaxID=529605 RepID=A0AAV1DK28_OLDCO|nr:OLC1v1006326C2 [Oldenlandia corymbosa var. corymbosa]